MTAIGREQALAFRVAGHHLHERLPPGSAATAAHVGLQDTPPDSAGLSLAARVRDAGRDDLASLVIVPSVRGAPMAVAPADLAIFTAGLDPPDEAAARAWILTAAKTLDGMPALEALDRVAAAVAAALADGPLARDDFHQALRERLPAQLLPWCRGCLSHHVHPSLWRAVGVRGVLAIVGRQGRAAVFGSPPPAPPKEDPGAELVRRFLRAYAPARPPVLAAWAGIAPAHAKALWARAGALAEVQLEGRRSWALPDDVETLAAPPAAAGVRLVPGYDPYLAQRDRELLAPDPAVRQRIWKILGNPGAVLVDGTLAGQWRATVRGRRLLVTVEPLEGMALPDDAVAAEAAGLAPWRGAETVDVRRAEG